jgi:hypothetical protein
MNQRMAEVIVMRRPAQRAAAACGVQDAQAGLEVREGTTGRVIARPQPAGRPRLVVVPPPRLQLERVWAVAEAAPSPQPDIPAQPEPELAFYRKYTEAMLRRYLQMSMTSGRVPSLMGREMFRGNVTHCRTHSLEDVVIFCMDMEKKLARLQPMEQRLIARIALQHYSRGETAAMLGLSLRSTIWRYGQALDRLTALLLEARMLEPMRDCQ